jgi:hypothetical protein
MNKDKDKFDCKWYEYSILLSSRIAERKYKRIFLLLIAKNRTNRIIRTNMKY